MQHEPCPCPPHRRVRRALALTSILGAALLALPAPRAAADDAADGEAMTRDVWAAMKAGDSAMLESRMSASFQSVHQDGARDRDGELELIRNLALGEYTLSDFRVTRAGDTLVVTYTVSVQETIGSEVLSKDPAPRMSVFQTSADGWQWIAHANLKGMASK